VSPQTGEQSPVPSQSSNIRDLTVNVDQKTVKVGGMDEPELKIIDVFFCKLRKKLANASEGKNTIETVWGRGYVLREPAEDEARIPA
jgi:hypothetical protein